MTSVSRCFQIVFAALMVMVISSHISPSLADDAETANLMKRSFVYKCVNEEYNYTQALVDCVSKPVRRAVLEPGTGLLALTSKAMLGIFMTLSTLAIVILGVRVATGDAGSMARVIPLAIRIGIVLTLLAGATTYAADMFGIFDQMMTIGSPTGFKPFRELDTFLANLLGFSSVVGNGSIKDGIIGLLNGSIFASNFGFLFALVGFFAIASLVVFVINVMYIYLASVIAFSFLLVIAPLLLPFFIFTYTEGYFTKWFNMLLSTIITPMLLFMFLSIFLLDQPAIPVSTQAAPTINRPCNANTPNTECTPNFNNTPIQRPAIFNSIINDIFNKLGPDYLQECLSHGQYLKPSRILLTDPYKQNYLACNSSLTNLSCSPNLTTPSYSISTLTLVDKGINDSAYTYAVCEFRNDNIIRPYLFQKLLELLIFTVLLNSVVKMIPSLASSLAGGVSTGVVDLTTPLTKVLQKLNK